MAENHNQSSALPERVAAPYLGFTMSAMRVWRREGRGPAYIRTGRSVRYLVSDLDAWMARHRVETRDSTPVHDSAPAHESGTRR